MYGSSGNVLGLFSLRNESDLSQAIAYIRPLQRSLDTSPRGGLPRGELH